MNKNEMKVEFWNEEDEEIILTFPAKHEVCPRCEGHGYHLRPAIGEHCFTQEEFYEAFSEPEDRDEYFKRGGIYDITCLQCKGKNVIQVIDEEQVEAYGSEEQKKNLKEYNKYLERKARWDAEDRAEARVERMMCGDY